MTKTAEELFQENTRLVHYLIQHNLDNPIYVIPDWSKEAKGHFLQRLRRSCGISLRGLASWLECTPETLFNWENGFVFMPYAKFSKACTAVGIRFFGDVRGDSKVDINTVVKGDMKQIGKWIEEKRKEKGLSRVRFAQGFGVSNIAVRAWELGVNRISVKSAEKMCKFLGTTVEKMQEEAAKIEVSAKRDMSSLIPEIPDHALVKDREEKAEPTTPGSSPVSVLQQKREDKQREIDELEEKRKNIEKELEHIDYGLKLFREIG